MRAIRCDLLAAIFFLVDTRCQSRISGHRHARVIDPQIVVGYYFPILDPYLLLHKQFIVELENVENAHLECTDQLIDRQHHRNIEQRMIAVAGDIYQMFQEVFHRRGFEFIQDCNILSKFRQKPQRIVADARLFNSESCPIWHESERSIENPTGNTAEARMFGWSWKAL